MLEQIVLLVVGIFLLIKGADYTVEGSSSLARKWGIPTIVIGMTIVAFGTSMPELIVNILAALRGSTEIAFGNIIGSNIANILLVLGMASLIYPIKVESSTIRKEIPFAILAVAVLFIISNHVLLDGIDITILTRVSGLVLLCFFAIFIYYAMEMAKKSKKKIESDELSIERRSGLLNASMIIGGIVGLFLGGQWTVNSAIEIARNIGLSEFLISATIIGIGTSLPELVTGIEAARKKEPSIIVGNTVGSNIFNIFWILGVTAIISPIVIPGFINTDIMILGGVSILLFLFVSLDKHHQLKRWQGIVFLTLYIGYLLFLGIRG